jgi:hypothetical protein
MEYDSDRNNINFIIKALNVNFISKFYCIYSNDKSSVCGIVQSNLMQNMKMRAFWDTAQCSLVIVHPRCDVVVNCNWINM